MLCFASALVAGVIAGNPAGTVLGRGLLVLIAAYAVGRLLETAGGRVLQPAPEAEPAAEGDPRVADREEAEGPKTFPLADPSSGRDDGSVAGRRQAA